MTRDFGKKSETALQAVPVLFPSAVHEKELTNKA
jgi:hypothetical protein